jgi:hypothetical protein
MIQGQSFYPKHEALRSGSSLQGIRVRSPTVSGLDFPLIPTNASTERERENDHLHKLNQHNKAWAINIQQDLPVKVVNYN